MRVYKCEGVVPHLKGWSLAASSRSSPMVVRISLRLALASSLERWGLKDSLYLEPLAWRSAFCASRRSCGGPCKFSIGACLVLVRVGLASMPAWRWCALAQRLCLLGAGARWPLALVLRVWRVWHPALVLVWPPPLL